MALSFVTSHGNIDHGTTSRRNDYQPRSRDHGPDQSPSQLYRSTTEPATTVIQYSAQSER